MSLLTDASLNNLKITKFGNTVVNRSIFKYGGGSAYFDGNGDYLRIGTTQTAVLQFPADFTVEMWYYPLSLSINQCLYDASLPSQAAVRADSFALAINTSGQLYFYHNGIPNYTSSHPIINSWNHIAISRSGSSLKVFLNGNDVLTLNNSINFNRGAALIGTVTETIGAYSVHGYIDDLRVTKGVARYITNFTPPTAQFPNNSTDDPHFNNVSLLLNFNPIVDSSTNNFDPTEVGDTKVDLAVKKFGNGAGYFDGTGDYLQTINSDAFNFAGGPFTIEMWVNPNPTQISFGGANGNAGAFVSTRISAVHSPLEFSIRTDLKMQVLIESSGGGSWQAILVSNTALIANTWSHIALIYDGLVTRLFINGVLDDNFTNNNFSYRNISNTLYIGSGGDGNFNGYIDDLRITKGVARYVGFIPPQQELPDNEAGTSLLLHLNNPFTDASQNNFTITPFGDATTSTSVVKYRSTSAQFDGSGDYLELPLDSDFDFGSGDFTIEFWVYPSTNASWQTYLARWGGGGQSFFIGSGSSFGLQLYLNGSLVINPPNITPSQWSHIAVSRSGSNVRMFVNGIQGGVTHSIGNTAIASTTEKLRIGADGGVNPTFTGYIDEVRITKGIARYTSNFTPPTAELPTTTDPHFSNVSLLLRTSRNFVDSSPNNFTVTRFGNVQISPSIKRLGSGSAYFDGSGDYLQTTISNWSPGASGEPFTIELWIYRLSGGGSTQVFIAKHGGVNAWNGTNGLNFNFYYTGTILYFEYWGNGGVRSISNTISLPLNQWIHLAVSYDGTTTRIFVNGVLQQTVSTISYVAPTNAPTLEIAGQISGTFPFNGYIDELRITKGVAKYTLNFTPPTAELPDPSDPQLENVSLLLKADGASGSTVFRDMSKNNHVLTTFGNTNINTSVRKFGTGSAFFDGSGDYLILSENNSFAFGTGDFTIEFWAYPLAFSSNNIYESRGSTEDTLTNRPTIYAAANTFRFYAGADRITSNSGKATGQWYHIAVCRNSGITRMFINGIKEGVDYTDTNDYGIGLNRPMIGGFKETQGDGWFNGYIDELRVTKGVARYTSNFVPHTAPFRSYLLTPFSTSTLSENLLAFWKLSDLKDSSNNRNTLANISSVQFVSGKVGNCAQFNGTNTLTSNSLTPAFNAGQSFSVAFWANPTSNVLGTVVGAQGGNTLNIHNNGDGSMSFNNAASGDVSIAGAFQVGVWKHYVCIVSGGRNKVYINGVLVYNQPSGVTYSATSTTIGIGRYPGGTTLPFQGLIDSVGIWQKELTQSEVNELYNSGNGLEP